MLTAAQAKELASYQKYFLEIKKAAISGKTSICVYEIIDYTVFEDLGYRVDIHNCQKDGISYTISW